MTWKKVNPKTVKVGKKCFISYKGNDINNVTFFGKKDGRYLFTDVKDKRKIHSLSLSDAQRMVYTK